MSITEIELQEIQDNIRSNERMLNHLETTITSFNCELDRQIQMDQIVCLEMTLQKLQEDLKQKMQLKEYQLMCQHEFIVDLIDIDPDKSSEIVYCKHCHLCK